MTGRRSLGAIALAASVVLATTAAPAQSQVNDTFKVAIGQLGLWAVDGPRLGQRAGIFKKHGLVLEIFGTSGGGETLQAVISGSADLTVGIGTAARAARLFEGRADPRDRRQFHRRRRPLLVCARGFADQAARGRHRQDHHRPIRRAARRATTSCSPSCRSSASRRCRPRPGRSRPRSPQVMSGQIDIGWARAAVRTEGGGRRQDPHHRQRQRRAVAAHARPFASTWSTPTCCKSARTRCCGSCAPIARPWTGCSPVPRRCGIYAEQIKVPLELAAMTRDKFQTREAMRNDRISDIDAVMADAVQLEVSRQAAHAGATRGADPDPAALSALSTSPCGR